jgi:hypothetical protein
VEVTVDLKRNEYIEGYMWAHYLGVESRPDVVGLILVLVLTILGLRTLLIIKPLRLGPVALVGPLLSVALVCCLPLYSYLRARMSFGARQWLQQPTRYCLTKTGITSSAASYSGSREWSRLRRVEENGRLFLVYLSQYQVVVIPKRCFGTHDQIRALRELIAANCPRVTLLND